MNEDHELISLFGNLYHNWDDMPAASSIMIQSFNGGPASSMYIGTTVRTGYSTERSRDDGESALRSSPFRGKPGA